jgi:hypothetical protein
MPTDPKIITLELQAIAGALRLAKNGIAQVSTQISPGPPTDPTQIQLFNTIVTTAQAIETTATTILATTSPTGGTTTPP